MIVEDIKFQSLKDYLANTNPSLEKQEAVYRLTFENGKCYVGQSIDVLQRIEQHFMEIQSEGRFTGLSWHRDAVRDNGLSFMPFYEMIKHIKIEIFLCKNSVEVEALILLNARENSQQAYYYNKQFYTPRQLGKKHESKGRDNSVIF